MQNPIKLSDYNSGQKIAQGGYRSFSPTLINRQWIIDDPELEALISKAHQKLGELNAFSELIPDVDFFIKMHIAKEATLSSRIEGTQTSMEEAFLRSEDIRPEERDDWQEVQNYIEAMNFAIQSLEELPLSNRLIKAAHEKLLQGVRGAHKQPGEFRRSQNWIGGATINDAVFVPPIHAEIPELMGDLELFLHNENIFISELVRIAIAHYQFETIHPFLDGNGRTGRLLITLYLVSKKILIRPSLYLSSFFEEHRSIYFDNLSGVRENSDMKQWLKFFMVGVIQIAESSVSTFRKITLLRQTTEKIISAFGRKKTNAQKLLDCLFSQPVITAKDVEQILEVSSPTAHSIIKDFVSSKILKEKTVRGRTHVFTFADYIELFEKK